MNKYLGIFLKKLFQINCNDNKIIGYIFKCLLKCLDNNHENLGKGEMDKEIVLHGMSTWAGFARRILFDKKSESVLPSMLSMNPKIMKHLVHGNV